MADRIVRNSNGPAKVFETWFTICTDKLVMITEIFVQTLRVHSVTRQKRSHAVDQMSILKHSIWTAHSFPKSP